ncbi:MAG: hypothetical protein ABI551_11075 [Polyangiaceae bacterium]
MMLLVGPLLLSLHLVLVPHRVCPIHGLEEVAVPVAPRVTISRVTLSQVASVCDVDDSAGPDKRCEQAFVPHEPHVTVVAVIRHLALPERSEARALGAASLSLQQTPLLFAPKQGPPA